MNFYHFNTNIWVFVSVLPRRPAPKEQLLKPNISPYKRHVDMWKSLNFILMLAVRMNICQHLVTSVV